MMEPPLFLSYKKSPLKREGWKSMRLMIRTHQPGQNTLNPDTLCRQTPRLIGAVSGNQNDFVVLAFQDFQRSLAFIDQRNDDFAVIGRIGFFDNDGVAVQDTGLNH